jgi:molecular chaperone GrpE
MVQGIEMIRYQLDEILKKMGVLPIKAEGQPFDPKTHEAVATIETDEYAEDTVIEEVYRGYTINNKVLRPSMVKVAKKVSPLRDV